MVEISRKRRRSLPSPPSSELKRKKLDSEHSWPGGPRDRTADDLDTKPIPHFDAAALPPATKRDFGLDGQVSEQEQEQGLIDSEARGHSSTALQQDQPKASLNGAQKLDPVAYWASNLKWPENFASMSGPESDGSKKRRWSRSSSYANQARQGLVPGAHSPAYEQVLEENGIILSDTVGAWDVMAADSKAECEALLQVTNLGPAYNSCSAEVFSRLFQRATNGNEERVRRDLTPLIVPSAELLYALGNETDLEHIREEMSVDWAKCALLGGTRPRPDYAYGLAWKAFTFEERAKINNYMNVDRPAKFTDFMYFPFLLCEVKSGTRNITEADRQNAHSASIAVQAIANLCRATGADMAQEVNGRVLVFSVSHDSERFKISGHFPLLEGDKMTYHRFNCCEYSLTGNRGRDRNKGSDFVRAIYRKFFPSHLERIRKAIARLPEPRETTTSSSPVDLGPGEEEDDDDPQARGEPSSTSGATDQGGRSQGNAGESVGVPRRVSTLRSET